MSVITDLWESHVEEDWSKALAGYWNNPAVQDNIEIERYMDTLDIEAVRHSTPEGWFAFLKLYFMWKFNNMYPEQRLADLQRNTTEHLTSVKKLIFESDLSDTRRAVEKAGYIKGLGAAGASGLLAVLFPAKFGTVDSKVIAFLCEIPTLPERAKLLKMSPMNLTNDNAVVLIEILRKQAARLNSLFNTNEWTPRKIDMILWNLRDGRRC